MSTQSSTYSRCSGAPSCRSSAVELLEVAVLHADDVGVGEREVDVEADERAEGVVAVGAPASTTPLGRRRAGSLAPDEDRPEHRRLLAKCR